MSSQAHAPSSKTSTELRFMRQSRIGQWALDWESRMFSSGLSSATKCHFDRAVFSFHLSKRRVRGPQWDAWPQGFLSSIHSCPVPSMQGTQHMAGEKLITKAGKWVSAFPPASVSLFIRPVLQTLPEVHHTDDPCLMMIRLMIFRLYESDIHSVGTIPPFYSSREWRFSNIFLGLALC